MSIFILKVVERKIFNVNIINFKKVDKPRRGVVGGGGLKLWIRFFLLNLGTL